jgi:hypothetical protein
MEYLLNRYEIVTEYTIHYNLTNTIGLTEFGSVMKTL